LARHFTGTLVTPMIVHAVYNGAVVVLVRVSDPGAEPTLRVAPVIVGLALAAFGVVLLRAARRSSPRRSRPR
jgi:hypothetical protein